MLDNITTPNPQPLAPLLHQLLGHPELPQRVHNAITEELAQIFDEANSEAQFATADYWSAGGAYAVQ